MDLEKSRHRLDSSLSMDDAEDRYQMDETKAARSAREAKEKAGALPAEAATAATAAAAAAAAASSAPKPMLRKGRPQLSRLDSLSVHMDISEIVDYLYLGAKTVSQDGDALADMGIHHIVNCTVEGPNHFEARGVKYLRVAVEDSPEADIACFLEQAHAFIEAARKENSKVLVHCTMGMSRSSTIVLAHLMYDGMRLKDAMALAKAKRSMVSPNSTFMAQLLELETKLYGAQSIDLGLYKKSRFGEVSSFAC